LGSEVGIGCFFQKKPSEIGFQTCFLRSAFFARGMQSGDFELFIARIKMK
jgi:hypothetical protein